MPGRSPRTPNRATGRWTTSDSARPSRGSTPTASCWPGAGTRTDRKSTRLNSSHLVISYAVFCLKKKNDCGCCQNRFYEKKEVVERYQRQSHKFKSSIAIELILRKRSNNVGDSCSTYNNTVIRRC